MAGDGSLQGYNAQVGGWPLSIVGQTVTQAANDKERLQPLLQAASSRRGSGPQESWPTWPG